MSEPANAIDKSSTTPAGRSNLSTGGAGANPGPVVPGANSFTESQARSRLRHDGYTQVSALTKGTDGIWRGTAKKNGTSVHVELDYKGHISSN